MTAKLPRTRLILSIQDLEPGDSGTINAWDLKVLKDGRVYIKKDCCINKILDPWVQTWEYVENRLIVEFTEDKKHILHVLEDKQFSVSEMPFKEDFQLYATFDEIKLYGEGFTFCKCCAGAGIVSSQKEYDSYAKGYRDAMERIQKLTKTDINSLRIQEKHRKS